MRFPSYRKWDVVWVNFPDTESHVLCGRHPAIVVTQNQVCNASQVLDVIAGTGSIEGAEHYLNQIVIPPSKSLGIFKPTRFDCNRFSEADVQWIDHCSGTLLNTPYLAAFETAMRDALELNANETQMQKVQMVFIFCPHCKSKFVVQAGAQTCVCRNCGNELQLNALLRYSVYCKDCGTRWTGLTNADPAAADLRSRCKCGNQIPISFDPKAKSFVATN